MKMIHVARKTQILITHGAEPEAPPLLSLRPGTGDGASPFRLLNWTNLGLDVTIRIE